MTRLATLAQRAALAAVACTALALPAAAQARTDDLSKPVVVLSGPEVPAGCKATAPLRSTIRKARPWVGGKALAFTGSFHLINVNPKGIPCGEDDATQVKADHLFDAAVAVSKTIAGLNRQHHGPVDVVALGTGGPILRYALTMAARKRAGFVGENEAAFEGDLDVEDAVVLSGAVNGLPSAPGSCGGGGLCDDLVRPTDPNASKPAQWRVMDSGDVGSRNPQGTGGTDWSLISLAGDRFTPEASALGMDAAHRTAYDLPTLTFERALADTSSALNMSAHYAHAPSTTFESSTKVAHPLGRIMQDLVWGGSVDQDSGTGPAYAPGCTGYVAPTPASIPESGAIPPSTAATVVLDPTLAAWSGDHRAVRVLKAGMLDAVANCFLPVQGSPGVYEVRGPSTVRINGLDFELTRSFARLQIDLRKRTVRRTAGTVEVSVAVNESQLLPMWTFDDSSRIDLNMKFPATSADGVIQGDDGTVLSLGSPSFQLFGLKSTGAITLRVVKGGFQLEGALSLPGVFSSNLAGTGDVQCGNGKDDDGDGKVDAVDPDCAGGTTGDFEDRSKSSGFAIAVGTSNANGLQLDKVTGNVGGQLRFGPFRTAGAIGFEYLKRDAELKFNLEASLPAVSGIGLKLKVGFKGGELASISGELNGLEIPLWTSGWYLQKVGLGLGGLATGQQLEILISTTLSFGKKIGGKLPMAIDGDLTVGWGAPWRFKLTGAFSVLGTQLGTAGLSYDQSVGARVDATVGREFGFFPDATGATRLTVIPQGKIAGQLSNNGDLDIGGVLQACLKGKPWPGKEWKDPWCVSKVDMRLAKFNGQPLTYAMCFRTNLLISGEVSVGFVARGSIENGALVVSFEAVSHACDVADYGAKVAQASGAASAFTIRPGGPDRVVVSLAGAGGTAPQVALVAPDGTRFAAPVDQMGGPAGPDAYAITGLGDRTAFVLGHPQVGRWTVEPVEGSPAVQRIDLATVLPEPRVTARVQRSRHGLRVRATAAQIPGQEVRIVERAAGLTHTLARLRRAGTRTVPFRPAFGPGGRRELVAIVLNHGSVRREISVGSYLAPAPRRVGRPRGITLRRSGARLAVGWHRVAGAGQYEVLVTLPSGRTEARIVRSTRVVVGHVRERGVIRVRIRALRAQDEAPGRPAHARGTGLRRAAHGR